MSRVKQGVNDLYTWCLNNGEFGKKLISEWTGIDESNFKLDINNVTYGSHLRIKWRCSQEHEWCESIHTRTGKRVGCPYCSGKRTSDKNSFKNWCLQNGDFGQQLSSEWTGLDENNKPVLIDKVSYGSQKKVKWKCNHGHEWMARILDRTIHKNCCPYCYKEEQGIIIAQAKLKSGVNDLKTWCNNNGDFGEQLISEWTGQDENDQPVSIDNVSYGSHKRVKWKCNQGHEWCVAILFRTKDKTRCPYCFGNYKVTDRNSLKSWCLNNGEFGQQIIKEWVGLDENNQPIHLDGVARGSAKKVKWRCSKGHVWCATILSRTNCKSGCPDCYNEEKSEIIAKSMLGVGINDLQTWCNNNRAFGQLLIAEWVGLDENNQPISMDSIAKLSGKKVKWKCDKGHEWYARIANRVNARCGCPSCSPTGTSYPEQYLYHALRQIYPNAENRCKVLKSPQHPQGIEFDIGIPEIPLCIEYSPTYWHEGKEEYDEYKNQICQEHNVRFIQIIEDSYRELDFKMEDNYICFRMKQGKRTEILQEVLEHLLKTLGHSILEIDFDKVEEDTRNCF